MKILWFKINLWKYCVTHNLSFLFWKLFLILIIYKIYIYNVIGLTIVSTVSSTSEPWTCNFSNSMMDPVLKILVYTMI